MAATTDDAQMVLKVPFVIGKASPLSETKFNLLRFLSLNPLLKYWFRINFCACISMFVIDNMSNV